MPRLNKVTLIGHLGADPDVKNLQNGGKAVSFSMATDDSYRDQQSGDRIERTDWHRCVVFAPKVIESIEKLKASSSLKGTQVYIEGKLRTRSYEQDGIKKYVTEIVISSFEGFQLLGKRDTNGTPPVASNDDANANGDHGTSPSPQAAADDDIPF